MMHFHILARVRISSSDTPNMLTCYLDYSETEIIVTRVRDLIASSLERTSSRPCLIILCEDLVHLVLHIMCF